MFRTRLIPVWVAIIFLSGMFLMGQDTWPPPATCVDNDGDGYGSPASNKCTYPGLDCDDTNADVYPGAPELCDGLDNDCDSAIPDAEVDCDLDGYVRCDPWVGDDPEIIGGGDCMEYSPENPWCPSYHIYFSSIYPGAPEIRDGFDNQCPGEAGYGEIDEGLGLADKVAFVTQATFTGNIGGQAVADAICTSEATIYGLAPGTYYAWISCQGAGADCKFPAEHFVKTNRWHLRTLDGPIVAYSFEDLVARNSYDSDDPDVYDYLRHPIDQTAAGQTPSQPYVWTDVAENGQTTIPIPPPDRVDCNEWASSEYADWGAVGRWNETHCGWTLGMDRVECEQGNFLSWTCNASNHLYCFQQ